MTEMADEKAHEPEDLPRMWTERANQGDAEGLLALYEPDAVIASPPGEVTAGTDALRKLFEDLVATGRTFGGGKDRPVLRSGDIAITSAIMNRVTTDSDGHETSVQGATVEVARRQPDGTWLYVIDRPSVFPRGPEIS
ncbi:MAG: YybH family protein [Acidimicrobiales bacterium]